MDKQSKIVLISGPTASGKSNIAVKIAKKIQGEIINADSMQVYKKLKILTARPNKIEQKNIKHHLYGVIDLKAISVFILRGTEVLLQRRALEKYHTPGLWANACCTHPAWEEPSDECDIPRLGEELGVQITDLEFRETLEYRADVGRV